MRIELVLLLAIVAVGVVVGSVLGLFAWVIVRLRSGDLEARSPRSEFTTDYSDTNFNSHHP